MSINLDRVSLKMCTQQSLISYLTHSYFFPQIVHPNMQSNVALNPSKVKAVAVCLVLQRRYPGGILTSELLTLTPTGFRPSSITTICGSIKASSINN